MSPKIISAAVAEPRAARFSNRADEFVSNVTAFHSSAGYRYSAQNIDFEPGFNCAVPSFGAEKRIFDIVFSLFALLTLGALMLIIAVAIRLFGGRGPMLFSHERVGANGKTFGCLKFRTMVPDATERLAALLEADPEAAAEFQASRKLTNDPRIIPGIGAFLRKTSLDELPQFINVLMGDMSIVGPRPVTEEEFETFYGENHPYMVARPGITGAWQVSGRNDVTYSERVAMDAAYVRNWSFAKDLRIIARTVSLVFLNCNGR